MLALHGALVLAPPLEPLGEVALKGIDRPVKAFRII
jgi:class 3 adenylate cyclase